MSGLKSGCARQVEADGLPASIGDRAGRARHGAQGIGEVCASTTDGRVSATAVPMALVPI